ncbi:MAG TPA: hypothetical protein PLC49_05960, partial [Caldisericia bacterium]|nr:hypothetical protein [Caldisericia bacterium]
MKQLRLLMSILCAFSCLVLPSQGKPSVAVPLAGPEWVTAGGQSYNATNGNVSNNSGRSWDPSLQLDPSGNPCIAWYDSTPANGEIFFARWNGSSWVNASGATLTSTNANVSNNSGESWDPS